MKCFRKAMFNETVFEYVMGLEEDYREIKNIASI